MSNASIKNAFERMWQHVVAGLGRKADISHTHDYHTKKLLWENASMSSAFSPQDIELTNFSSYDAFEVTYGSYYGEESSMATTGEIPMIQQFASMSYLMISVGELYATIHNDGISFFAKSGSSGITRPYKIYGVKYGS